MTRASVPEAHAWNFWTAEHPAELVHLPSGVHLAFCAYADSTGRFTRFAAGRDVRLGAREIDARRVHL